MCTVGPRLSNLKVFSLNVHSWTNPDREPFELIDNAIYEMVKSLKPDVSCFQEVKHPHPAEPASGQNIVRITANDRTLFRFGSEETNEEIRQRLVIPEDLVTFSYEEEQFLMNQRFRNNKRYLDPAFPYESKISCKPSTITSLMKIAQGMGAGADNVHFAPAHSNTFGNAVIFKPNGTAESKSLKVHGGENRVATKVILHTGHNWDFAVINLHLDHLKEEVRINQIKVLLDWMNWSGLSYVPHIIVGDFNAVSYWTPEVSDSRARCNLQPSTDALYNFITGHGYVDLEKIFPPRTTSIYNVRVDYIFCSRMLLPRINMEKTQFDVINSKSDHSAMLVDLVIRKLKLLIGVVCAEKHSFADDLKDLILKNGLGQTEVIKDISALPEKFLNVDNVIVEVKDIIEFLPLFDFVFCVESSIDMGIGGKLHRNVFEISVADKAFEQIKNYLIR